jgi:hypothetical protein
MPVTGRRWAGIQGRHPRRFPEVARTYADRDRPFEESSMRCFERVASDVDPQP